MWSELGCMDGDGQASRHLSSVSSKIKASPEQGAMTQPSLWDVIGKPIGADPLSMGKGENPVAEEIVRRSRNKDRVLARLEQGPATNVELVAIGGMRAMGRVHELRQAGYRIITERVDGGLWRVTLQPQN